MKSLYTKLQNVVLFAGIAFLAQGCAQQLGKDDPGHPGSHPNSETLIRKYQHVQRYNCDGSLRDDDIESIQEPTQWVSITPNGGAPADGLDVANRQNGDTASWQVGSGNDYSFLIKYNTAEGGLKVERGLNIVDYNFYHCDTAGGGCSSKTSVESGTVSFDVTYIEQTLPGVSVQHVPCPSPTPSP